MDLMANTKFREFINQFQSLKSRNTTLEEARKQSGAFFCPPSLPREHVEKITDVTAKGKEGHAIPMRLYIPRQEKKLPVIVFYHRGGWVFCNVEEADPVCRKLANHLGCIIASVDYRLAPENPFPKPLDDCYDAFLWVSQHIEAFGGNPQKIVVAGESAGGNLATVVSIKARDEKGPPIAAQLLLYPVISSTINEQAYQQSADKFFITQESMQFFWNMYTQNAAAANHPYASPDKVNDLRHLPPAIMITAEHDPLCVEGELYAKQLQQAGVPTVIDCIPGVIHGFLDLPIYEDSETIAWLMRIKEHLKVLTN